MTVAMLPVPAWAGLPGRTGVGLNVGLASLTVRPVAVAAQTTPPPARAACAEGASLVRAATLADEAGAHRPSIVPVAIRAAAAVLSRILVVLGLGKLTVPPRNSGVAGGPKLKISFLVRT